MSDTSGTAVLDAFAPNFRRAVECWPDAPSLKKHHFALAKAVEGAVDSSQLELTKSFIESVCVTVLSENGSPVPLGYPGTTELLVAALGCLGLQNSRGASKVDKVLSAYNRLSDALNEARNELGGAAHGKDAFLDVLAVEHARVFLLTGDALLALVMNARDGTEPDIRYTREPFERFTHLNRRIDKSVLLSADVLEDEGRSTLTVSIQAYPSGDIVELLIEPSQLLYCIDRTAYLSVLESVAPMPDDETVDPAPLKPYHEPPAQAIEVSLDPIIVDTYEGRLSSLHNELCSFLRAQGAECCERDISSVLASVDQVVGVDWQRREGQQARVRVILRRLFTALDYGERSKALAEQVTAWFLMNATAMDSWE